MGSACLFEWKGLATWTASSFASTSLPSSELEMLASKWVNMVVCALRRGRLRNGELARKLEGISPKMLMRTLRLLERDGLVRREIFRVFRGSNTN